MDVGGKKQKSCVQLHHDHHKRQSVRGKVANYDEHQLPLTQTFLLSSRETSHMTTSHLDITVYTQTHTDTQDDSSRLKDKSNAGVKHLNSNSHVVSRTFFGRTDKTRTRLEGKERSPQWGYSAISSVTIINNFDSNKMNSVVFKRRSSVCFLRWPLKKCVILFTCARKTLCRRPPPLDGGMKLFLEVRVGCGGIVVSWKF